MRTLAIICAGIAVVIFMLMLAANIAMDEAEKEGLAKWGYDR